MVQYNTVDKDKPLSSTNIELRFSGSAEVDDLQLLCSFCKYI